MGPIPSNLTLFAGLGLLFVFGMYANLVNAWHKSIDQGRQRVTLGNSPEPL